MMHRSRAIVVAACLAAAVVAVGAIVYFSGGSNRGSAATNDIASDSSGDEQATDIGAGLTKDPVVLALPGWRRAEQTRNDDNDGVRGYFRDAEAGRDAERIAATRPHLVYDTVEWRHGPEHSLSGTIEPTDIQGIQGLIAMSDISMDGHITAPPREHLNKLGYVVRVLMPVLSPEGSIEPLNGTEEFVDRVREGLASAGMVVPERSWVAQLLAAPRSTDMDSNLHFDLERDPRDFERAAKLRERSGLTIEPIEGAILTGSFSTAYQNAEQEDREIAFRFIFDKQTESWILHGIALMTSPQAQIHYFKQHGRMMNASDQGHAINFLSVLPDCVIVADDRLLLCEDD